MKRLFILSLMSLFILAGCGGTPEVEQPELANPCFKDAPGWVIEGGAEGGLSAVGAANVSKAGMQFTRTAALGNARDEMARSIEVKVNNMLKDFTQSTGIGDDEVVDKMTASVSKQVSSQTLAGTKQKAIWISPCNEMYILIESNPTEIQDAVKNAAKSSLKNDNALWQQFQAQKAQDELDAAVMKEFTAE